MPIAAESNKLVSYLAINASSAPLEVNNRVLAEGSKSIDKKNPPVIITLLLDNLISKTRIVPVPSILLQVTKLPLRSYFAKKPAPEVFAVVKFETPTAGLKSMVLV